MLIDNNEELKKLLINKLDEMMDDQPADGLNEIYYNLEYLLIKEPRYYKLNKNLEKNLQTYIKKYK